MPALRTELSFRRTTPRDCETPEALLAVMVTVWSSPPLLIDVKLSRVVCWDPPALKALMVVLPACVSAASATPVAWAPPRSLKPKTLVAPTEFNRNFESLVLVMVIAPPPTVATSPAAAVVALAANCALRASAAPAAVAVVTVTARDCVGPPPTENSSVSEAAAKVPETLPVIVL